MLLQSYKLTVKDIILPPKYTCMRVHDSVPINLCYLQTLLNSTRHVYKGSICSFPTFPPPWQEQRAVEGHQGQDYRPARGWNELQDHRQEVLWEGDNGWFDYLEMKDSDWWNTINRPQSGVPCKILHHGVRMILKKVLDHLKTTQEELVNNLKAVSGYTVTKKTVANTTLWWIDILQCLKGPPVQEGTCAGLS